VFSILGCGQKADINLKAPTDITKSFAAIETDANLPSAPPEALSPLGSNRFNLAIQKKSLDKEFLLTASLLFQEEETSGVGLNGKIVSFKRQENSVFLLESTKGHVVTDDIPATSLLAEIPIVEETKDALILDWNKGMQKVFVQSSLSGHSSNPEYQYGAGTVGIKIEFSFIDKISMRANFLEIKQIFQSEQMTMQGSVYPTFAVKYFITPYNPNPNFEKRAPKYAKLAGFFETAPLLEPTTGELSINISKWDHNKQINFHVSANTPPEYVEAVKEGILYWNKAFGKDVITASMAPAGITAPDPEFNVVQWIPWNKGGGARADLLADPRTGEILHGQIYLTSVFAFNTKIRAEDLLRQLLTEEEKTETATRHAHPTLKFLAPQTECNNHSLSDSTFKAQLARVLKSTIENGSDDSVFLKLSQDVVRNTVAHEIGHVLGLRHNFAGNLEANVSIKEQKEHFRRYLIEGVVPGEENIFSTTTMDYLPTIDDSMIGSQIPTLSKALPYDTAAIKWGYFGVAPDQNTTPLFCTDEEVSAYADCKQNDSGKNPLVYNLSEINDGISTLPFLLVNTFMFAKSPVNPVNARELNEINFSTDSLVKGYIELFLKQISWLKSSTKTVAIERKFPFIGEMNSEEVLKAKLNNIENQIDILGGVKNTFFSLFPMPNTITHCSETLCYLPSNFSSKNVTDLITVPFKNTLYSKLVSYLERDDVRNFTGLDGNKHSFTKNEIEYIKKTGKIFIDNFEEKLLANLLAALASARLELDFDVNGYIADGSISKQFEILLPIVAEKIIFETKPDEFNVTKIQNTDGSITEIKTPVFLYSQSARISAASIINSAMSAALEWLDVETRTALHQKYEKMLTDIMGAKPSDINLKKLPHKLRYWLSDEIAVLNSI